MLTFGNFLCNDNQSEGFRRLSGDTLFLSNSTYQVDSNRIIYVDTRQGEFTISFPSIAESGDVICIIDIGNNLLTEPVRLINLKRIGGVDTNSFMLDVPSSSYKFYYVSDVFGWVYEHSTVNVIGDNSMSDVTWLQILSKPSTIAGYGITDAFTKAEVNSLISGMTAPTWSSILSKPTTLSGFGITDAYTKTEVDSLVAGGGSAITWNTILNKPTTIAGYGITDGVKRYNTIVATSNQQINAFDSVFVNVDNITLTLPSAPAYGDEITIFNGNSITTQVYGNGKLIAGNVNNFVLDVRNVGIRLVYMNSNGGNWMVH